MIPRTFDGCDWPAGRRALRQLGLRRPASARMLLKNICRVKGQEENTLHGLGLVIGLKGTGDGGDFLPTIRSLATALQLMGNNPFDKQNGIDIKDAKNVALVMVTATVPAAGARQGDTLDCIGQFDRQRQEPGRRHAVHDAAARSAGAAAGRRPSETRRHAARGGQPGLSRFAQGLLHVDGLPPTVATIHKGCRLEEDFFNVFSKEGKITLVLDKNHADFQVAQDVAELVNSQLNFQSHEGYLAKALNAVNIEVTIPQQYRDDPVLFISQVLSLPMFEPHAEARVVINERTGSVVIGGDVEIGSVVVTHKNVVVETGDNTAASRFVPLDVEKDVDRQAQVAGRVAQRGESADRRHHRHHQRTGTQRQAARHADHRIKRLRRPTVCNRHRIWNCHRSSQDRRDGPGEPVASPAAEGRARAAQRNAQARSTRSSAKRSMARCSASMRKTVGKAAYFDGGRAEEIFRGQLDQVIVAETGRIDRQKLFRPDVRTVLAAAKVTLRCIASGGGFDGAERRDCELPDTRRERCRVKPTTLGNLVLCQSNGSLN